MLVLSFFDGSMPAQDSRRLCQNLFSSFDFNGLCYELLPNPGRTVAPRVELGSNYFISELGPLLKGISSWREILLCSLIPENTELVFELVDPLLSKSGLVFSGFNDTRFSLKLILALLEPPSLLSRFFFLFCISDSKNISVSLSNVGSVSKI